MADDDKSGNPAPDPSICQFAEAMFAIFDLLLGDNLSGRKTYFEQNGHKFLEQLDVV